MFISNPTTPILFVISFSFFLYAVLSVALCAALLMVYAVVTARDGYEDEAGFHATERTDAPKPNWVMRRGRRGDQSTGPVGSLS